MKADCKKVEDDEDEEAKKKLSGEAHDKSWQVGWNRVHVGSNRMYITKKERKKKVSFSSTRILDAMPLPDIK